MRQREIAVGLREQSPRRGRADRHDAHRIGIALAEHGAQPLDRLGLHERDIGREDALVLRDSLVYGLFDLRDLVGVIARLRLKSKRSFSSSTSEPFWSTSPPSTSRSAQLSKWVVVWFERMRSRRLALKRDHAFVADVDLAVRDAAEMQDVRPEAAACPRSRTSRRSSRRAACPCRRLTAHRRVAGCAIEDERDAVFETRACSSKLLPFHIASTRAVSGLPSNLK
jgi:hypothetical protein